MKKQEEKWKLKLFQKNEFHESTVNELQQIIKNIEEKFEKVQKNLENEKNKNTSLVKNHNSLLETIHNVTFSNLIFIKFIKEQKENTVLQKDIICKSNDNTRKIQ